MQDPGYELPRKSIPRTPVNKGKERKGYPRNGILRQNACMAGTEDTAPERPSTSSCLGTIITLLGAIGGYVGVLAVLVRPVGVTALWLQLLGSNLVTDNGAVWYAAWKAPTTTIIRNF